MSRVEDIVVAALTEKPELSALRAIVFAPMTQVPPLLPNGALTSLQLDVYFERKYTFELLELTASRLRKMAEFADFLILTFPEGATVRIDPNTYARLVKAIQTAHMQFFHAASSVRSPINEEIGKHAKAHVALTCTSDEDRRVLDHIAELSRSLTSLKSAIILAADMEDSENQSDAPSAAAALGEQQQ